MHLMTTDERCAHCKRGHYSFPDGSLTNGPCYSDKCECFVCDMIFDDIAIAALLAALLLQGQDDAEQEG